MERVCDELDEAKAEIEKLKAEYKTKVELYESLKRAYDEQLIKIQETNAKFERQAQELNEKFDEISTVRQTYEELEPCMKEKESIIKNLSSTNDKLRVICDEKLRKWEEENRELVVALDEANSKNMDQEQKLIAFKEEVKGLKSLLSASENKCLEAEKKGKACKELTLRDEVLLKLEEENSKVEDQLKWKKEQFKHLEEAHEKVRAQFQASKKEWEVEKSTLLGEISTLQTNFDTQKRISEGLQSRLEMCNQALTHEESRRKYLEVQLSEAKTGFDNVLAEYQEAKSEIDCLTDQRDKDIAILRNLLGTKEILHKELEYQKGRIEQENQELLSSLKELQEAQIQEAGTSSSLSKLRNKLKGLEQMHRECSKNLRAKEAEWTSEFEKMAEDLNGCRSELESKDAVVKELKVELADCHSSIMHLEVQNEETSLMLLVLKSVISEAQLKLANEMAGTDLTNREREEKVSLLVQELETKRAAHAKAQKNIQENHETMASLFSKVESSSLIEQQQFQLQDELERHKEMLKESSVYRSQFKEQALQMESDLKKVHDALNRANNELAEKFCDGNELEFELQIWKSIAERLTSKLEENEQMRKQVEASLLAEVDVEVTLKQDKESLAHALEEKDMTIDDLQRQLLQLGEVLNTRETASASSSSTETATPCELTKEAPLQSSTEKEKISNVLPRETEYLEQECVRRELEGTILAHISAERAYEDDRGNFHRLLDERDRRIDDLHQLLMSLEEKLKNSASSFSSQLSEKQAEFNKLLKAWEKIATAEVLKEIEIQEKTVVIVELKDHIGNLQKKLNSEQKTCSSSKDDREKIEAELQAKQLEIKKLTSDLRSSDAIVDKLESQKRKLLEDVKKLSSDRETVLEIIGSLSERINKLSIEDMQLLELLERTMQNFDNSGRKCDMKGDDDLFDPAKENLNSRHSFMTKIGDSTADERSPFRALNN